MSKPGLSSVWFEWKSEWEWICECVRRKGCQASEIRIFRPLPEREVKRFEEVTGLSLPDDYAQTITGFARSIEFSWTLRKRGSKPVYGIIRRQSKEKAGGFWRRWWPFGKRDEADDVPEELVIRVREGMSGREISVAATRAYEALKAASKRDESNWVKPPEPIEEVYTGGTGVVPMWESEVDLLTNWRELQEILSSWREGVGDGEAERKVYRAFYPLINVGDGDRVVMDLNSNPVRILFLDHEHYFSLRAATCLGRGFSNFMTRWSHLGCPALHSEFIQPFLSETEGLLDHEGENAGIWREWLGRRE